MQRTNANYKKEVVATEEMKDLVTEYDQDVTKFLADFDFRPDKYRGFQAIAKFDNGFGMSVVPESDQERYEVAILRNGKLDYHSGITRDVLRYQSADDVHKVAARVRNLKEGYFTDF